MPNWCWNRLTITGPEDQLTRFREQAEGNGPAYFIPKEKKKYMSSGRHEVLDFHQIVPVPEELLLKEYGDGGYDWEAEHWGCKWGACRSQIVSLRDNLAYEFETPWAPPMDFLLTASSMWPELKFRCSYDEPGMCFRGVFEVSKGDLDNEEYEEYEYEEVEDDED